MASAGRCKALLEQSARFGCGPVRQLKDFVEVLFRRAQHGGIHRLAQGAGAVTWPIRGQQLLGQFGVAQQEASVIVNQEDAQLQRQVAAQGGAALGLELMCNGSVSGIKLAVSAGQVAQVPGLGHHLPVREAMRGVERLALQWKEGVQMGP